MTENHHLTEPDAPITLRPEDLDAFIRARLFEPRYVPYAAA